MNPDVAFERCLELLYKAALDDARCPAASAPIDEVYGVRGQRPDGRQRDRRRGPTKRGRTTGCAGTGVAQGVKPACRFTPDNCCYRALVS